jgi:murein DD-endopeptidase MepM/ murein hydrolase activator NlpD
VSDPRRLHETVTFLYMPGETGRMRRFGVQRLWLRRAGMTLGVLSVALTCVLVDYVNVRLRVRELPALRSESAQQREQIAQYTEKLGEISRHLEHVAELDRKLRVITNLDPADPLPLPGVGRLEESGDLPITGGLARANRERRHRQLLGEFGKLAQAAQSQAGSLGVLMTHLENQSARLSSTPSISPTRGWVTSGFGYRTSPFTGGREFHRGLDIASRMGTVIIAPADGEVVSTGSKNGFGATLTIRHGYGIETLYGHLDSVLVQVGQTVARGDKIALMGNTGRSTGPHLHYQVQVSGKPVDPQNYILD